MALGNSNTYVQSIVSQVQSDREVPHLVSQIRSMSYLYALCTSTRILTNHLKPVPTTELEGSESSPWYLFNDFLVKNIEADEVFSFKGSWKVSHSEILANIECLPRKITLV